MGETRLTPEDTCAPTYKHIPGYAHPVHQPTCSQVWEVRGRPAAPAATCPLPGPFGTADDPARHRTSKEGMAR
jgi:hypothetical protein